MPETAARYTEPGGSWRPLWVIAAFLVLLLGLDLALPGGDVPPVVWILAFVAVLGVVAGGILSARRVWTVRVDGRGPDAALSVGRERVALADVDAGHLRAVRDGEAGVDAGAPLRLTDGRTVLVPTRDPLALITALLQRTGDTPEDGSGSRRTLDR
jgi:hypothetical protein